MAVLCRDHFPQIVRAALHLLDFLTVQQCLWPAGYRHADAETLRFLASHLSIMKQ